MYDGGGLYDPPPALDVKVDDDDDDDADADAIGGGGGKVVVKSLADLFRNTMDPPTMTARTTNPTILARTQILILPSRPS
jgi:hypothetical protein